MKTHKSNQAQLKRALQAAIKPVAPSAAPKKVSPPSDQALFLAAMQGVKPLKNGENRQRHSYSAPTKITEQHKRRQQNASQASKALPALLGISDYYSPDYNEAPRADYLNSTCGTDVLRNLKKDRWAMMASIDLHGATLEQARVRLEYFLQHCLAESYKCVRIVHGVGYGSKNSGPVLPTAGRRWLCQLDFGLAYTDCKPNEGGAGAVKVLLRL